MKPYTCADIESRLWRHVDRELAAPELTAVGSHLKECEECHQLYLERAQEAGAYKEAFRDSPFGDSFVFKFRQRMVKEGLQGAPDSKSKSTGHRRFAWNRNRALAAAALVLLVPALVAVFILKMAGDSSLGIFEVAGGSVRLARAETTVGNAVEGGHVFSGDSFRVPAGVTATLRLKSSGDKEESVLRLEGPSLFGVGLSCTLEDFLCYLDIGTLRAKVAPNPERVQFAVETPHASATVVGTQFTLVVPSGQRTVLTVEEGKVEFQARPDLSEGGGQEVTPRDGAWVARKGEAGVSRDEGGVTSDSTTAKGDPPDPPGKPTAGPTTGKTESTPPAKPAPQPPGPGTTDSTGGPAGPSAQDVEDHPVNGRRK